jgi:HEPN domain-containing protein
MSHSEAILHWRSGARDAWKWAKRMAQEDSRALAIFHCHLAVEKALKALYMEQKNDPAPFTHSLTQLASHIDREWTKQDLEDLHILTPFASQARYDDLGWVEEQATAEFTEQCIQQSKILLSKLDCALEN